MQESLKTPMRSCCPPFPGLGVVACGHLQPRRAVHKAAVHPFSSIIFLELWPASGQKPFRKLENCFQTLSIKIKTTCCILRGEGTRDRAWQLSCLTVFLASVFLMVTHPPPAHFHSLLKWGSLICVKTLVTP